MLIRNILAIVDEDGVVTKQERVENEPGQIEEFANTHACIFLLILYDLTKLLYRTFGDFYKEIVEKIAKKLHEGSQ